MTDLILGLDPGTRRTGYGVIARRGGDLHHVDHGVICLSADWALPKRLKILRAELHAVFERHRIAEVAVEKIFFGKNADSAFKLGHARGICLCVSAEHDAKVGEYAATFVKKSVTGSGGASKDHVRMVAFNLLKIKDFGVALDASDALALAIAHARVAEQEELVRRATEGARP